MPVTRFALVRKIGRLKPEFLLKTSTARLMCVSRFLFANDLVYRVATHTAQRPPDEVHEDAKSHLAVAVPKCVGPTRDPRFILNMDQTNCQFGNSPKNTINQRGARTIKPKMPIEPVIVVGADQISSAAVTWTPLSVAMANGRCPTG